jgi:hypothetical protein
MLLLHPDSHYKEVVEASYRIHATILKQRSQDLFLNYRSTRSQTLVVLLYRPEPE